MASIVSFRRVYGFQDTSVRDERIEREKARLRYLKQQERSLEEAKRRDSSSASGQRQLAELRKSLNLPARPKSDNESG